MYVTMAEPTALPVTNPDVNPTEATVGLLLDQVPPVVTLYKVVVPPRHTVLLPVIGAGAAVMVTTIVAILVPTNETVVVPGDTPVSTPVIESIVAWPVLLYQLPPVGVPETE
jgi:hypothetical protein